MLTLKTCSRGFKDTRSHMSVCSAVNKQAHKNIFTHAPGNVECLFLCKWPISGIGFLSAARSGTVAVGIPDSSSLSQQRGFAKMLTNPDFACDSTNLRSLFCCLCNHLDSELCGSRNCVIHIVFPST